MGAAVGNAAPPPEDARVGVGADVLVGCADTAVAGTEVAVADEPQAIMNPRNNNNGVRLNILFLNCHPSRMM